MRDNINQHFFEVIKPARTNPIQQIEAMTTNLRLSQCASALDACKCTGNCST